MRPIKVIEIVVTQHSDDYWSACSPDFPWLTAEGVARLNVVREISQIAPNILKDAGINVSFWLVWKTAKDGATL